MTATATRMMQSLPSYYGGNTIIERIVQARANEIDRIDGMIDTIKAGMVPGDATDELGLLSLWERTLGLPPTPPDASVAQRQAAVKAKLRALSVVTAAEVLDMLTAAVGRSFTVLRNTPGQLQDTIDIPYASGSFLAAQVEQIAARVWSAHRQVFIHFDGGFILDGALLDTDEL